VLDYFELLDGVYSETLLDGFIEWLKRSPGERRQPAEYPSPSTCWRRLKRWDEDGTWLRIWRAFIAELDARGRLQWETAFIDGTSVFLERDAHGSVHALSCDAL
jgi:transposase